MTRKWFPFAVVFALMGIAILVTVLRHKPVPQARTGAPVALPAAVGLTFTGTIRPQHVIGFGATTKGKIENFLVEPGQEISEGDALAHLGSLNMNVERENASTDVEKAQQRVVDAEAAYSAALLEQSRASAEMEKARMTRAESDAAFALTQRRNDSGAIPRQTYERQKKEHDQAISAFNTLDKALRAAAESAEGAQKQLDQRKSALEAANEKLREVEEQRASLDVRSPVDGWVVGRNGQIGQDVEEIGDQMFQVATDIAALEVTVTPKPEILKKLYPGMPTLVLIPEVTSAALGGTVKSVSDKEAVVEFVSATPSILPGMKADVRFKVD
jgi:multidrug resistance efflux pump